MERRATAIGDGPAKAAMQSSMRSGALSKPAQNFQLNLPLAA
jgi:hypothetical protein